jgi:hypothetical protein
MRDYTSIGFFVSKISTLFPLWKQVNLQVGIKGWKIWEDRPENIQNLPKNDVIVLEDDPLEEATTSALNTFVRNDGILIHLFPLGDEAGFEFMIKDGVLSGETYKPLLEGIDAVEFASRCKGLDVKISRADGIMVSLSRNLFTTEENDNADAPRQEEVVKEFPFFVNLVKFLAAMKVDVDKKKADELKAPSSKVALMILGASMWSEGKESSIENVVQAVFHHLAIDDLFPQVIKERAYRSIDPERLDVFPEIYYYHCSFSDGEVDDISRRADDYLDQAKQVRATIRTERYWEQDARLVFFLDLARFYSEIKGLKRLYLLPPVQVATKSRETTSKLLARCFLEPLATTGLESFQVSISGATPSITPVIPDIKKVKVRVTDEHKALVLLHGPELAASIKDKTISVFLTELEAKIAGGMGADVLKILVHVAVNQIRLQNSIKEMTFNTKKVDEKKRERIKRDIEHAQEKLHSSMRIEKEKKTFEERGFTIIEIEDSLDADQDAKEFFIDQVLPVLLARKIGQIHELLPASIEGYFKTITSLMIPAEHVQRIST